MERKEVLTLAALWMALETGCQQKEGRHESHILYYYPTYKTLQHGQIGRKLNVHQWTLETERFEWRQLRGGRFLLGLEPS